ncbi:serine--tRNA ligase [Streptomyces sp. NPDC001741]|uniref:serine--tRNA ligase n=1 Tax=Streptomyces sp. NPDC001741 TaxID=3364605 RepID=UPI00369089C0
MHDVRELLKLGAEAERKLARRRYTLDLSGLREAHRHRSDSLATLERLRAELKKSGAGHRAGAEGPSEDERERARSLRERVQAAEADVRAVEAALREQLLRIPNLPLDEVPDGHTEKDAVEIRRGGPPVRKDVEARHHAEIGADLGILDTEGASRLSGARFAVLKGAGARLERALVSFLLDLHTQRHGYTEYSVPHLVTRDTMTGTGQLPKFEEDLFATSAGDRELFLIPTAEVPLTNLVAREPADEGALPLALTAATPCYRAEAGSYGRDTRGILRLHQFEKVELVRVCTPERAREELDVLVGHATDCLEQLGLSYRVVVLPAGDTGFSARMTYDIEVWLPGSDTYREVSSCSDCGDFQARRAGIRYRDAAGRRRPAATLNGSALPVGRTVAALLEQGLQPDGSVRLPECLVPYTGFRRILPGGGTALTMPG